MNYEYYKAMVYLFEKILPTLTDNRIDIYSRKSRCAYCSNFDIDDKKTYKIQVFVEKQKVGKDEVWILKILKNCSRCKSYENETIELKYVTRDNDYEIVYPTRFDEEHMLKEKCLKCGSNLYHNSSECAGSGGSHEFCKKCGFTGKNMCWD